jgi:2-dehydropantoate 2-reductase
VRFAIVGAGAMGCVYGGKLALAGHDVSLVDIRQDHVDRINERGLELRAPDGHHELVHLPATTDPSSLDPVDVQLYLCKGFATAEAARGMGHALTDDGWAVSVQNGLGNERALADVFGAARVVPGTTTVGAMSDEPGTTTMSPGTAAGSSLTHLGPPEGSGDVPAGVHVLADALTAAGLPAKADADADVVLWTKLAMAVSMGPLTAILRRTVQDVVDDRFALDLWRDMFDEVVAVAAAEGVHLDLDEVRQHCEDTYRLVGHHVTSMAADVVAHRRTEIDTMALEIARRGREHGVPTPVVGTVGRLVKALEGSYERAL